MDSTETPTWKKLSVGALITVGLVLTVRLVLMGFDLGPQGRPETPAEFHSTLRRAAQMERENWERNWRESGRPEPSGGFDAAWKAAMGGIDPNEIAEAGLSATGTASEAAPANSN